MDDPTTWSWLHPYTLVEITPMVVAVTFFYAGVVVWLHAWRTR